MRSFYNKCFTNKLISAHSLFCQNVSTLKNRKKECFEDIKRSNKIRDEFYSSIIYYSYIENLKSTKEYIYFIYLQNIYNNINIFKNKGKLYSSNDGLLCDKLKDNNNNNNNINICNSNIFCNYYNVHVKEKSLYHSFNYINDVRQKRKNKENEETEKKKTVQYLSCNINANVNYHLQKIYNHNLNNNVSKEINTKNESFIYYYNNNEMKTNNIKIKMKHINNAYIKNIPYKKKKIITLGFPNKFYPITYRYFSSDTNKKEEGTENEKNIKINNGDNRYKEDFIYERENKNDEEKHKKRTKNSFCDELEKLKVKELDKILNQLEMLYNNKNSKININVRILGYIFKNFLLKNKELKRKIFCSFFFLLCSKMAIIYTPILLSTFIENVNLQKSLSNSIDIYSSTNKSSVLLLCAYVLSRILSSTMNELRNSVFSNISQKISTFVSKLFFYKIHNLNLTYILSKKNGELSFIFNRGCKSITNLLNVMVFQIIPIIIEFILYLYILTYKIHYSVSLVTCFNMFLYVLFTTLITKRRTIIRKHMNKAEQNTFNIFLDSIQNVEQVKYYTNEIHELKKFIKEQKKYEKEAINVQKSLSFLNFGQQIILNTNLFLCMYLTYLNIANDVFPFSYLILVNTLLFQLAMPLNMFGTIYRETKLSLVDIESMIKILVKKIKSPDYGNQMLIKNGNIKFEKVYFKYPLNEETNELEQNCQATEKDTNIINNINNINNNNNNMYTCQNNVGNTPRYNIITSSINKLKKWYLDKINHNKTNVQYNYNDVKEINPIITQNLKKEIKENINTHLQNHNIINNSVNSNNNFLFQNFTCHIENGEKVAIIGKSGSGKSSLIKLLLKFYEVNSGNIYIDNKNIDDIDLYTLRKNISVVPQDTILFNNTISYNIKYGNFQCSDKEMIQASIKAELHDKIIKMENKYDTIVGERGTKLSIGEKQRICIARCFLKDSKIIVLDEHASNLDNENKKAIEKALTKLCMGKTTFIITHVMENLNHMDKIIFFCGKNIYVGSHKDLMDDNKLYREYYDSKNNKTL
ncbi:ABC transporter, (heavy metal transporter family), putative [Plasmodium sp. DRC-Itaito]|nr:ABC transporter, (heavy metal transporter family), putative [Plasmodium sp. DRC-Itaito]